jgi:drug/metabolite transporter (DMT)-like permease
MSTEPVAAAPILVKPQDGNVLNGMLLMCLGVAMFTVMDALAKWQAERYDVLQVVFFRAAFGIVPMLPILLRGGVRRLLYTNRLGLHLLRGLIGTVSLIVFFLSFRYLELADAVVLSFASPLFMTALSVPILGETVGWRRWTAIFVGLAGVIVMVQPGGDLFTLLALLPIFGAFTYALVGVTIKILSRTEESVTIVFYFSVFAAIIAGAALPFVWVTPADASDWIGQISIGLIGGVAQLAMTQAFRLAPVSAIAPFDYSAIIWATLVGYWVWGDLPSTWTWAGAVLVVGSGLYILQRETSLARKARATA